MSGGGDGGAAARAAQDRADQKARERRIKKNIDLIDILFQNDPSGIEADKLALTDELAAFGPKVKKKIPNPAFQGIAGTDANLGQFPEFIFQNFDPNKKRKKEINRELKLSDEALNLLGEGPTKIEREAEVVGDVENFFFDDLNEQREDAGKAIKFELSRRGGFGGSQELDALEKFQKKEDRGRLDIGNVAINARNDLRAQDAQLKASLIDQANRDISTDVLTNQFVGNLGQGLAQARDTAKLTQFDPFFENAGTLFTNVELARGEQAGRDRARRAMSFFSADPKRNFGFVSA